MVHVHKPEHGSCGACPGAEGCPMRYCPTCPTPVLCEQAEALTPGATAAAVGQIADRIDPDPSGSFGRPERRESRPGPSLGRIVHVLVHPHLNNGSDVAPAVVVRLWPRAEGQPPLVNLRVFLDGTNHSHEWATSRYVWANEQEAREHDEHPHGVGVSAHAFWPPLVTRLEEQREAPL